MHERLEYVKLAPGRMLDAGCGQGEDLRLLHARYPAAETIGIDSALPALRRGLRSRTPVQRALRFLGHSAKLACADLARLPFADSHFDLVWSNLALSWTPRASDAFAEFNRVMAPGGLLMFCTYGPDTLKEIKAAFATVDSHSHVQDFADMHDLGDALVAAGFAAPVMDMDVVTLTYESVEALALDLKRSGQTHTGPGRRRGLMGRDAWMRVGSRYESARQDGRLPATVELVFGHAWKAQPRRPDAVAPIHFHR